MKNGFVGTMLLGLFLLVAIIVFGGTVADDIVVHNKIQNLKKLTDVSSLAAAGYYMNNGEDTDAAEASVRTMLEKTELGSEVRDTMTFEWDFVSDPDIKYVKAIITNYNQSTFWYRFLEKDNFLIDLIESQAKITGEMHPNKTSDLTPLGVNICGRDGTDDEFSLNDPYTFTFTISPYYIDSDMNGMFAIDPACDYPTGNSNFAHWKNLFGNNEIDTSSYDMDNVEDGCFVDTSFTNPLSVDPMQFYNSIKNFDLPFELDILVLDCGTTYSNDNVTNPGELVVSDILTLRVTGLPNLINTTIDGNNAKIMTIETLIGGFPESELEF